MDPSIASQLIEINRQFYGAFAAQYSKSRRVLQPGIGRALGTLGDFRSLLDLGCGDGRVGWAISEGALDRRLPLYVGVDASEALLNQRQGDLGDHLATWRGHVADFCEPGWESRIGLEAGSFDAAIFFSALHHVPGRELQTSVMKSLKFLLKPGGRLAISAWQISHLERFQKKFTDWSAAGIDAARVDAGDYLVDWRRDGVGYRYVHEFREEELIELCEKVGLRCVESYRSDGESMDMGLYVIVERGD
jgi:SAM-dependent methyltransferase